MLSLFSIILIVILAADLLWWWYADRLARPLRHAFWWRLLIALFMAGQVALVLWILGGRALVEDLGSRPPQALERRGLPLAPAHPACFLGCRRDGRHNPLAGAVWASLHHADHAGLPESSSEADSSSSELSASGSSCTHEPAYKESDGATVNRRQLLGMLTAGTPALLTGGSVAYSLGQLHRFRIRAMELALPALPPELDGLRIALVSDMHVGTFTCGRAVQRMWRRPTAFRRTSCCSPAT